MDMHCTLSLYYTTYVCVYKYVLSAAFSHHASPCMVISVAVVLPQHDGGEIELGESTREQCSVHA